MQDNHFLCTTLLFDLRQWPYLSNNHHSLFTIQYIYNMYCPWQRNDTLLGAPFCVRIEGMSVILFNHQSCSLTCCWLNFTWNLWTEFYSNFVYKSHLAWIMEFEGKKSGPFQQTRWLLIGFNHLCCCIRRWNGILTRSVLKRRIWCAMRSTINGCAEKWPSSSGSQKGWPRSRLRSWKKWPTKISGRKPK